MVRRLSLLSVALFALTSSACNSLLGNEEPTLVRDTSTMDPGPAKAKCSGCAELSVPFQSYDQAQAFDLYLSQPWDFRGAIVNVRMRLVNARAGGVVVYAKNAGGEYPAAGSAWWNFTDLSSEWQTLSFEVDAAVYREPGFDPTNVSILELLLSSGSEPDVPLVSPSVVQIDQVNVLGPGLSGWDFESNASAVVVLEDMVEGSKVSWVGP